MGISSSSERSSTAFSKSLQIQHVSTTNCAGIWDMCSRLVVFENLLHVALLKVISHGVGPFESHPTLDDLIHRLASKLYLDPCQVGSHLHLFHLLLCLGIEIE